MEQKIIAWVARDEDGIIALFTNKPVKKQHWWIHPRFGLGNVNKIPEKSFPQVKWEDKEPTEVELTIKIKD